MLNNLSWAREERSLSAHLPEPIVLFQLDRIFHEEHLKWNQFFNEGIRVHRSDALMYVVVESDAPANLRLDLFEHFDDFAYAGFGIEGVCLYVNPLAPWLAHLCNRRRHLLCTVRACSLFSEQYFLILLQTSSGLCRRHAGRSKRLRCISHQRDGNAHVGHLALDVPQHHDESRLVAVLKGTSVPVGLQVYELLE